jgi:hypothetical protein
METVEYYLVGVSADVISELGLRTEPACSAGGDGSDVDGICVYAPAETEESTVARLHALTGVEPFCSDGLD